MICPLKFTNGDNPLCDKEECGFYSGKKCAFASISDITGELSELKTELNKTTETLDGLNKRLIMVTAALI